MPRRLLALGALAVLAGCGSSGGGTTTVRDTQTETVTSAASTPSTPSSTTTAAPATTSTSATTTSATASGSHCAASQLSASLDLTGAAGHQEGGLVFKNTSAKTCTLKGYPGVSFVGDAGKQLGQPATRTPGNSPTVTLNPGDSAAAGIRIADVDAYDQATCMPAAAKGLRVYPPDERSALFVAQDLKTCTTSTVTVTIQPVNDAR